MDYADFFSRHERVVLQFSAGKDAAACLWLLQPWWDKLDVVWCCQGNPYKETLAYMQVIESLVPHFYIVTGKQKDWVAEHGYPVDVLPCETTEIGMLSQGLTGLKLQPSWQCCGENAWKPMLEFVKQRDYTGVIRGQKASDPNRAPIKSGDVIDGIEYLFPVENWNDLQVVESLGPRLPPSYLRGIPTSLDCKDCTAYVSGNGRRIADLGYTDPEAYASVKVVHNYLQSRLRAHLNYLES